VRSRAVLQAEQPPWRIGIETSFVHGSPALTVEGGEFAMIRKPIAGVMLLVLFNGVRSFGQQPAPQVKESSRYRTLFAISGGGGGFALGCLGGIAAFDDALYASRKVWTTALISAAGGAVSGYFLGRALDRRAAGKVVPPIPRKVPDVLELSLMRANQALQNPAAVPGLLQDWTLPAAPKLHPFPAPAAVCGAKSERSRPAVRKRERSRRRVGIMTGSVGCCPR